MSMGKNGSYFSSALRSLLSFFCVSSEGKKVKFSDDAAPSGPEATMVAAAKHFSSAHKHTNANAADCDESTAEQQTTSL
ncbi:hypothetical protein RJ640_008075 [Escallonia rubra]|uniref:Uncharacterized protein n=1 Tax=Escallonia rubra TaxID=112253 RepID=A0AA88QPH6_9ASTE|nr:hypothetical protein RJ640_008075 [Escallonia rubra]